MMKEWKPSDRRGFAMLAILALLSAVAGLFAFHAGNDIRWLIGAIMIIASWPYTFFVVVPLNNRLLAMSTTDAGVEARVLVRDWGILEWGLSAIGVLSAATFMWALS